MFGLKPKPLPQVIGDELYAAQREFLTATWNAEYWTSQADMLSRRVQRLTSYTLPQPPKEPSSGPSQP